MTNTLEQRKEVAERLRDWADDLAESREIDFELCGCEVTGNDPYHAHDCARHIADLIDPTCTPVVDDVYGMPDELVCSECGCCLAITVDGKPSEPLYRYCPVCGARIKEVRDGE